jgi:hypothetical protein
MISNAGYYFVYTGSIRLLASEVQVFYNLVGTP